MFPQHGQVLHVAAWWRALVMRFTASVEKGFGPILPPDREQQAALGIGAIWQYESIEPKNAATYWDTLKHVKIHLWCTSLHHPWISFCFFWAFYLLYFSSWTLVAARYFQLAMFLALLMALFLPDMWVILNQADNSVLDVLLTLVRKGNVGNVGNGNVPVFSKTKMSKTNSVGKQ